MKTDAKELLTRPLRGRERVFERLAKRLVHHGARLWDVRLDDKTTPLALWACLRPRGSVAINSLNPSRRQPCVVIDYLLVGSILGPKSAGVADGLWSMEVSDHALLRFLDRHPRVDLGAMLFDAHISALGFPEKEIQLGLDNVVPLAASDGVLFCETISGYEVSGGQPQIHFRAKTWLHNDQMAGQELLAQTESDHPAGRSWLLPAPLHSVVRTKDAFSVIVPSWAKGFGSPSHLRTLE